MILLVSPYWLCLRRSRSSYLFVANRLTARCYRTCNCLYCRRVGENEPMSSHFTAQRINLKAPRSDDHRFEDILISTTRRNHDETRRRSCHYSSLSATIYTENMCFYYSSEKQIISPVFFVRAPTVCDCS